MSRNEKLRRRGRIIAQAVVGVAVTVPTVLWTVQLIQQIFTPTPASEQVQCRPGVRALVGAVRHARQAAAAETGGERAAVDTFRETLLPAWAARAQLTQACAGDPEAMQALREVDSLRYAEEHAVRYEVQELALRRRRIHALDPTLAGVPADPTPAAPSSGSAAPP